MQWNFFLAERYAKERHGQLLEEAARGRLLARRPHPAFELRRRLGRWLVRVGQHLQETTPRWSHEHLF